MVQYLGCMAAHLCLGHSSGRIGKIILGNRYGKVWCNLDFNFLSTMHAAIQSNLPTSSLSPSWNYNELSNNSIHSEFHSFDYHMASAFTSDDGARLVLPIAPFPFNIPPVSDALIGAAGLQDSGLELAFPESSALEGNALQDPNVSNNESPLYQYYSNTPMAKRVSSFRWQYGHAGIVPKQKLSSKAMGIYLGIELAKARPTPIVILPNIIFPDSSLPFPLNTALLDKLDQFWDPIKKKVIPPAAYTEKSVKEWLNAIGYSLTHATEVQRPSREWSTQSTNSPIPQAELDRKPDIVLINSADGSEIRQWKGIYAVTEVTSRPTWHTDLKYQINNKTYLILSDQHTRRFVPFFVMCSTMSYLVVTDREGQVYVEIDHLQEGEYHALHLLRVIAGLMFATKEFLGFDRSIRNVDGGLQISAGSTVYRVTSLVHAVRGVIGRSTRVFSGYDIKDPNKKLCIIKDGWIQEGRADAEKEHMEKLKGITGVPELIWGGTVELEVSDGNTLREDKTSWIRHGFSDGKKYRIHRRLVMGPVGENLSSFTSLGELVAALRDVIVGMSVAIFIHQMLIVNPIAHKACCDKGVLHRDLSFNNILLARNPKHSAEKPRQGLLIDFDYAASVSPARKAEIGQRTVRFFPTM